VRSQKGGEGVRFLSLAFYSGIGFVFVSVITLIVTLIASTSVRHGFFDPPFDSFMIRAKDLLWSLNYSLSNIVFGAILAVVSRIGLLLAKSSGQV
jgi:hypothetical protein